MQMIAFYLLRGHPLDRLVNLPLMDKIFYNAVMQLEFEHKAKERERYV